MYFAMGFNLGAEMIYCILQCKPNSMDATQIIWNKPYLFLAWIKSYAAMVLPLRK
jgi:hypothetical protein